MQEFQDFKVQWAENKTTKTNKPYKKLNIENSVGTKFDVNIFSDFPDFSNIMPGSTIRGKLEQKGQYWNIVSETQGKPRGNSNYKQEQIERTMDKKADTISKFQDKKEESIALMAAQRDAVLIVTQIMTREFISDEDIKKLITEWRNWFLSDEFRTPPPF